MSSGAASSATVDNPRVRGPLGLLSVTALNMYGGSLTLISAIDSFRTVRPTLRVRLLEPTRETANRARPNYRLRAHVLSALGPAVTYNRRTTDDYDRKIIGVVGETGEVNGRVVKLMLDLDASSASRLLAELVQREILVKTSKAQRGPGVTYGAGPAFPLRPRQRAKRA
jgi:hypothetical protein